VANDFEMSDKVRIPALYAEIERLKGEIMRLKADDTPYSEIDMNMHVEAVTKDLKAEIERLRAALNNIVTRYDTKQDGWHAEDMKEIARRALEGR